MVEESVDAIENLDVGYRIECGCMPVLLAIQMEQLEIAEHLVNKGMSSQGIVCPQERASGHSCVQLAAERPAFVGLLKLLLAN